MLDYSCTSVVLLNRHSPAHEGLAYVAVVLSCLMWFTEKNKTAATEAIEGMFFLLIEEMINCSRKLKKTYFGLMIKKQNNYHQYTRPNTTAN